MTDMIRQLTDEESRAANALLVDVLGDSYPPKMKAIDYKSFDETQSLDTVAANVRNLRAVVRGLEQEIRALHKDMMQTNYRIDVATRRRGFFYLVKAFFRGLFQ